jgi:hypothetical protein
LLLKCSALHVEWHTQPKISAADVADDLLDPIAMNIVSTFDVGARKIGLQFPDEGFVAIAESHCANATIGGAHQ